jgi:hypothetical protein
MRRPGTARRTARRTALAALSTAAVAAALTAAAPSSAAAGPARSAAAVRAAAAASPAGTDLLLNGTAETSQCSNGGWEETTVPGWQITAADPVINCYGVPTGASTSTPGSPTKGAAYFQGGSRGSSQMQQVTDVSSAAAAIDGGGVHSTLSGWLGGVGGYNDAAKVTITYRDASGTALGTSAIGPVLAADRGNTTSFVQKSATAAVPAGTRSILTTVDFTMTGTQNDGMADDLSLVLDTPATAPALAVPASTVPAFDHVFVVMMENNNYSASSNTVDGGAGIIGNSSAPYINNTLVPMGSLLTNYHASTHNSDPNYEAVAFGSSYGRSSEAGNANCITDPACTATNNGLSDNLDAIGKSWKEYIQTQTSNCQTTSSGNYENDDAPFYYAAKMKNDNAYCQAHWQPLPQLLNTDLASAATTPAFVWADADSCYDMEGCGIASGDTWLSQTLPTLFSSPAWTQQKSLLILTFDEDGNNSPAGFGPGQTNQVMTLAIGSQGAVKAGYQDGNRYDHYSTARVIEGALGLTATMTNNDKWATPYNEVFTNTQTGNDFALSVSPTSATVNAGSSVTSTVTTSLVSGSAENITLSASGLPSGVSASFNPATVTAGGTSTLTLTASPSAATASANVSVTGTAASATHSAGYSLNVVGTSGPIVSGGLYTIVMTGGLIIDDPGSSTSTGTQLIVYPLNSPATNNQRWTFTANSDGTYQIKNATSGLCMDDSGASTNAGSQIIQWTCHGGNNQHWSVRADSSSYELVNKTSGLSVTAASNTSAAKLTQQADTSSSLQLFTFSKVG